MKTIAISLLVSGAIAAGVFVVGGHAAHLATVLNPVKPTTNPQAAMFYDPNAVPRFIPGDQPCSCTMCCTLPS